MTCKPATVTRGFPALRFVGSSGWKASLSLAPRMTFLLCINCDNSNLLQQDTCKGGFYPEARLPFKKPLFQGLGDVDLWGKFTSS